MTIIYTVFSLANFIAPPIVTMVGPRGVMFVGGLCYAAFIGKNSFKSGNIIHTYNTTG